MKNVAITIITSIIMTSTIASADIAPYRTPAVNSINRLSARAIAVPCESAGMAMQIAMGRKARTDSKWLQSLDGEWDFKWKHTVDEREWEKSAKINVPSCWQLQGEYDPPLYVNVIYPIAFDPAGDPMTEPPRDYTSWYYRNPVGLYSREFTIPDDWQGRRVVIHFGGVSSAMYVRVNGKDVGYSEDSRLPAEFDLTPYLVKGVNKLEVEVMKHSDGTFLEGQDFWRLSGIFRSVWLVSEREEDPKDLIVETTLSEDFQMGYLTIRDENGNELLRKVYDQPRLWSCERPNLYYETVCFNKKDASTPFGDYRAVAFGFRRVVIRDSVLYINGRRALIMGVNRHEMSEYNGYSVTLADMKRDIAIMKDLNINAVRTSHYPNDPTWYELCDREGLYVVCEANIESHGAGEWVAGGYKNRLSQDELWKASHVERGSNMVSTFRNHPSIIMWSLGNECGDGANFSAEFAAIKALDSTRPIHYEGSQDGPNSEIKCPMYARPWEVENYVANNPAKPFILCEYSHSMGNSTGDIQDYWDIVRKYQSMQGGFIWDFVDQAIYKTDDRGTYLSYGGDWGDKPNDDNFNCNGILAADRTYHPAAYEVKHVYQPINVIAFDWQAREATIENRWCFTTLDDVKGSWVAEKDGSEIATGELNLVSFLPESTRKAKLDFGEADCVTFRFMRANNEIAHDQFVKPFVPRDFPITLELKPNALDIFKFNFWRAPIDNDRGWNMPEVTKVWKESTLSQTLPDGAKGSIFVKDLGNKRYFVRLDVELSESLPPVPRIGLSFTIPKEYDTVKWYGKGPNENYCDRCSGALLGNYAMKLDELNPTNYSEVGECGYRTSVRRLEFVSAKGETIRIEALSRPFGFNAWPYSQLELERAKHQRDLVEANEITVNIDAVQMGVGGDNSWGARPHDDDMITSGSYVLDFVIEGDL